MLEHEHEHEHEHCELNDKSGCGCHHHHHDHDHCDMHDDCGCHHHHKQKDEKKERILLLIRAIVSIALLVVSFLVNSNVTVIILLVLSYLVIGYDVLINAIINIFHGEFFDELFLMSLASATALIVSLVAPQSGIDGYDGILVMLLYQVGEFLQDFAVDKSRESITDMLELDIDEVIKVVDDKNIIIKPEQIEVDDILLVKPGQKIPTDGIIVEGNTSLDSSMLTGESKPLEVYVNDKVLSGCINNEATIKIKALTNIENSTSSKVKKMVEQANTKKAKSERFITKFAKIYTPIVILISLIVMFVPPLFLGFNEHFLNYLYKGLAIMVVSCPCALVISIPLSFFIGIGKSAKSMILVKGSTYLEMLSECNCIAFDKTGTITTGKLELTSFNSKDDKLFIDLLYSLESNFTHPIAKSIANHFKDKAELLKVEQLVNIPGYGIKAIYNNKEVLIGNKKLLDNNNIDYDVVDNYNTIIYVCYDNDFLGHLIIEDITKEDAQDAIHKLQENYHVALISGDNEKVVKNVAESLKIEDYYYDCLPEKKVEVVKKLQENNKVVYVGDGINDAACLLSADVGIAMKSLGSDIAIQASDIVIMDDKISSINKAIKIAKKTMRIVKENIFLSLFIKIAIMVLAIVIRLPMFIAIIGDVGVCLLAIVNSLRITNTK